MGWNLVEVTYGEVGSRGSLGWYVRDIPLQHNSSENFGIVESNALWFPTLVTPPFIKTDSLHQDKMLKPGISGTEIKYEYAAELFTLMFRFTLSLT